MSLTPWAQQIRKSYWTVQLKDIRSHTTGEVNFGKILSHCNYFCKCLISCTPSYIPQNVSNSHSERIHCYSKFEDWRKNSFASPLLRKLTEERKAHRWKLPPKDFKTYEITSESTEQLWKMGKWKCCVSVFDKTFHTSINAWKAEEQHPCPFLILTFHVYIYSVYLET